MKLINACLEMLCKGFYLTEEYQLTGSDDILTNIVKQCDIKYSKKGLCNFFKYLIICLFCYLTR